MTQDTPPAPRRTWGHGKCLHCRKIFPKTKPWSKYCKSKCRDSWHNDIRILKEPAEFEIKNALKKEIK